MGQKADITDFELWSKMDERSAEEVKPKYCDEPIFNCDACKKGFRDEAQMASWFCMINPNLPEFARDMYKLFGSKLRVQSQDSPLGLTVRFRADFAFSFRSGITLKEFVERSTIIEISGRDLANLLTGNNAPDSVITSLGKLLCDICPHKDDCDDCIVDKDRKQR
jgi:hypothetical protein